MIVQAQVRIKGSRGAVWAAITDIAHASDVISGIESVEMLDTPDDGVVGLRWRETRILFGEPATVEKWITDASTNEFYQTRAESDGFVFVTTMRITSSSGETTLVSSHESRPQGLAARLKAIPMALFFRGVIRKAILQDLNDIKAVVERE